MRSIGVSELASVIGAKVLHIGKVKAVSNFCQDTRKLNDGDVFFAIKGDAFDGHDYIVKAIEDGASVIILDNEAKLDDLDLKAENLIGLPVSLLLVKDSSKAIQDLSRYYLSTLSPVKIAITGSVGKTSTRDIIYSICKQKYKTQKNEANFNTIVGVPLTILGFSEDIEVAVLEMGMDAKGEINTMASIVEPDIAIITNIGTSHVERLGSVDDIFDAKMEVANHLTEDKILIINADSRYLNTQNIRRFLSDTKNKNRYRSHNFSILEVGKIASDNISDGIKLIDYKRIDDKISEITILDDKVKKTFTTNLKGWHNALNICIGIEIAKLLNISDEKLQKALADIEITGKRLANIKTPYIDILDDTYNASPKSMIAGLEVLGEIKDKRKLAILGDMFELGELSEQYHAEVGAKARKICDFVISVGKAARYMNANLHFNTKEELIMRLDEFIKKDDAVFVKASRGMHLEEVVNALETLEINNGKLFK